MKAGLLLTLTLGMFTAPLGAQMNCVTAEYRNELLAKNPSLSAKLNAIESFIRLQPTTDATSRIEGKVYQIPVVVHIIYHDASEKAKITDAQVNAQLNVLNACFRRLNADTTKTPGHFKQLAADCEIEFVLAKSDPGRRSTTGIIRKYTPITKWTADDKVKFSSEMGDDAWDTKSYLNIWVCNLEKLAGYASFPGGPMDKDGVVMDFDAFGVYSNSAYGLGKTAVHEVGHWLGLNHIWGDALCGDDGVGDTPKQASYTPGCPTTIRSTCGNGPYGDMYMNYMDFTSDLCTNIFTKGQKERMRALFANGGPRAALLVSKGLDIPLYQNAPPVESAEPQWLQAQLYPNPAHNDLTLDLVYDARWIGQSVRITNLQGQNIMNLTITSKTQRIDISQLKPGIYILAAKRADGESILKRFMKL